MNANRRPSALAPFDARGYRYLWPADLATSWAFEMETLLLGWYVLVESKSVFMFTVFASLQYIGTLIGPVLGMVGDRTGARALLASMRLLYAALATLLMGLIFSDALTPLYAIVIATGTGLVRPSDLGVRAAVLGDIMPTEHLMAAVAIQRTTQDTARIAGALAGAGLATTLGMGTAYVVVEVLYALSAALTLQARGKPTEAGPAHQAHAREGRSPWTDLLEGAAYVRRTPHLFALLCFALLLNTAAFPLFYGTLPYVAKEVYRLDQAALGYLVAAAASGALIGSIALSRLGGLIRPARMMLVFSSAWMLLLFVFAHVEHFALGLAVLVLAGIAHSAGLIPIAMMLLRNCDARYRGRVMGIRMLAIYGNLPGLLLFGWMVGRFGYPATASAYCLAGLALTLLVGVRWRNDLWRLESAVNAH